MFATNELVGVELSKLPEKLIYVCMMTLGLVTTVHANPSSCYSIQNQDRKNYCLATAKNQKSYCYSIRESDTKNFCLAQVGNQRSYCYSIRSQDTKNQCLATVR
jgi:hypothetical protein